MRKSWEKCCYGAATVLLGIIFLASAKTESVDSIAERLRQADIRTESSIPSQEANLAEQMIFSPEELKNQAAGRDGYLLREYLEKHPDGYLYQHYAGSYIDFNNVFVILFTGEKAAFDEELTQIGFETKVSLKAGKGSYFQNMENIQRMNDAITRINLKVLGEDGTEEEKALMQYYPNVQYDDKENIVMVRFVTDDDSLERVISLYEKLVGKYEGIVYGICGQADIQLRLCSEAVHPGAESE